jgi:hypothetical protein
MERKWRSRCYLLKPRCCTVMEPSELAVAGKAKRQASTPQELSRAGSELTEKPLGSEMSKTDPPPNG